MPTYPKSPADETLREIVRRIAEVAQPERIIMFGSAARGEAEPDSDLDLLVRYADSPALIIQPALREGRVIYAS